MQYNPRLYNVSMLPDSYYRYFEVGNGFFITNGGSPAYASTYDFKKYGNLLGGVADPTLAGNATSNSYLQGEILRTSFLNVLWSIYTIQLCLCDYFSDACNESLEYSRRIATLASKSKAGIVPLIQYRILQDEKS